VKHGPGVGGKRKEERHRQQRDETDPHEHRADDAGVEPSGMFVRHQQPQERRG
jgi:hypothetical protein